MAAQKERFSLAFGCKIFNVNGQKLDEILLFGQTTIVTERISGTEVFDDPTHLEPDNCKDVDVKPLLEKDPLIGINVSCFRESLVIKIHPKICHKIKYAVCKITLINQWTNGSPLEYVRCWIGEIRAHIWRYKAPYNSTEYTQPSFGFIPSKALIVHYDFSFSTGGDVRLSSITILDRLLEGTNFNLPNYLDMKVNTTKRIPTALDALKSLWTSRSFTDVNLAFPNGSFPSHKALLCARLSTFKPLIIEANENIHFCYSNAYISKFLMFLYTDDFNNDLSYYNVLLLYNLASFFEVEFLLTKCRQYFTDLYVKTASFILQLAYDMGDLSMREVTESYMRTHFDLLHKTRFWQDLSKNYEKLAKEVCLSKYIKKKTIH